MGSIMSRTKTRSARDVENDPSITSTGKAQGPTSVRELAASPSNDLKDLLKSVGKGDSSDEAPLGHAESDVYMGTIRMTAASWEGENEGANDAHRLTLLAVLAADNFRREGLPDFQIFRRFSWLNLVNLLCYQNELRIMENQFSKDVSLLTKLEEQEKLRRKIEAYSTPLIEAIFTNAQSDKALLDYEHLLKLEQPAFDEMKLVTDPFDDCLHGESKPERDEVDGVRIVGERSDPLRELLRKYLPPTLIYTKRQKTYLEGVSEGVLFIPTKLTLDRKSNRTLFPADLYIVDKIARIMFGILGGVVLLVPLVVLTFIENNHYRLLATTLFTFVFVLFMAFFSDASNQELIGATAAYTAVLVVFVGSALSAGS